MIKLTEKQIQNCILQWLVYQPGLIAWQNNSTGIFDPVAKRYRKSGRFAINGTPDIMCVMNLMDIGVFIGLEVKAAKGKQSASQVAFEYSLKRVNGFYFVVRSIEDTKQALKDVKLVVESTIRRISS